MAGDRKCPLGEFLFDDALRSSSGAFRCLTQGRQPMDAICENYDFPVCREKDYLKCDFYITRLQEVLAQTS